MAPAFNRLVLSKSTNDDLRKAVQWTVDYICTRARGAVDNEALRDDIEGMMNLDAPESIRNTGMRAFLLMALFMEDDLALQIARQGPEETHFARDMRERVLPALVPMYIDDLASRPDTFVTLALCLHRMWSGEPLHHLHSTARSIPRLKWPTWDVASP